MIVLIFCEHFTPAYKGGGPIQSLKSLVGILPTSHQIFVVCSAFDLGEEIPLSNINVDCWNKQTTGNVYYATKVSWSLLRSIFKYCNPDVIYINGIFSVGFNLLPLIFAKVNLIDVIVAPRGMLHQGALNVKPLKKKLYFMLLAMIGLPKSLKWHATDQQEADDVKRLFSGQGAVFIAPDTPNFQAHDLAILNRKPKAPNELRLVYLSLIARKKNLHVALKAVAKLETPIQFHIYGPIKDHDYWKELKQHLNSSIHQIIYKGSLIPDDVPKVLATYDALILPTSGENFGHVVYESLSVGTPVIVSKFTPWGQLQLQQAGFTVPTLEESDWVAAIEYFLKLDKSAHEQLSHGAKLLAEKCFDKSLILRKYEEMFASGMNQNDIF